MLLAKSYVCKGPWPCVFYAATFWWMISTHEDHNRAAECSRNYSTINAGWSKHGPSEYDPNNDLAIQVLAPRLHTEYPVDNSAGEDNRPQFLIHEGTNGQSSLDSEHVKLWQANGAGLKQIAKHHALKTWHQLREKLVSFSD